jgi:hypothetical protein
MHDWFSMKEWKDKSFIIFGRSIISGKKVQNTLLEISDYPLNHLTVLISNIEKINLFGLLNCDKFDAYKLKCNFPDQLVQKLIKLYDGFDSVLLKSGSEYSRGKSHYEILQQLQHSNRANKFVQIYKLADLTSTNPPTTASGGRSFSTLRKIKIYLRSTETQDRGNSHSCQ